MAELRLVEHYSSTQGEGPSTGRMTQFVRFAGCDMRCAGWPCDTAFASDPKIWAKDSYKRTPQELIADIVEQSAETGARNICLTGGEPFMQPAEKMNELILGLHDLGFTVEAFSNGSFLYSNVALEYVTFMMDWKLDGSGEGKTKLDNRMLNATKLRNGSGIKFVCKDEKDLDQAVGVWTKLQDKVEPKTRFWAGATWGVLKEKDVVEFIMKNKLPWSLNVQVHNFIWPANERGK
jgi:7-carboxy-7-deazaguanine synthase